ncbi:MAG TPA: hypothetical protein DCG19_09910 [Cryomorphaceae bacterium]|nr:hypothetical protein [Cryomorphaceae bacterium]
MKKVLLAVLVVILLGTAYGAYLWFKPHRDIQGETASHKLTSTELSEAYSQGQEGANEIYLDQVVLVSGTVEEKDDTHIKLSGGVFCNGDFSNAELSEGSQASIKGRVVGYDDLFGEVRIDNCTVEN